MSDTRIDADKASAQNDGPKMDSTTETNRTTEPWTNMIPNGSISVTQKFAVTLVSGMNNRFNNTNINNPKLWGFWWGAPKREPEPEHEDNKDSSSNNTTMNGARDSRAPC